MKCRETRCGRTYFDHMMVASVYRNGVRFTFSTKIIIMTLDALFSGEKSGLAIEKILP